LRPKLVGAIINYIHIVKVGYIIVFVIELHGKYKILEKCEVITG
jgi:hypothetical protein